MQNSRSTNGRRLAAAMFLGATSTAMAAGTAHADGGVTGATVDQNYRDQGSVAMTGDPQAPTALIGLDAPHSDNTLWTYCIQKKVELQQDETYDEHDWSSESTRIGIDQQHLEGIKWILGNSYPQQGDLGKLAASAGVADSLSPTEAVEGTQAAIWDMSDASGGTKLDKANESDPNVVALYDWLVAQATGHMSDSAQPQASLNISELTKNPQAGSKVALKLTSNTPGSAISVALTGADKTGAKLVDASGKATAAKATFKSGDTVYVQLSNSVAKGTVTLTASSTVSGIEAGRVFVSHDGKASQNLILAQAQTTPVSATATLNWAPVPATVPSSSPSTAPSSSPSTTPTTTAPSTAPTTPTGGTTTSTPTGSHLAHTGADNTMALAGGALALVAAGGGMVVYTRRGGKQSMHS